MTKAPKKQAGIFRDPWRSHPTNLQEPAEPKKVFVPPKTPELEEDLRPVQTFSIEIPNYGGISVTGVTSKVELASVLLDFCVRNLALVEPTLTEYGVLVAQTESTAITLPFYVSRKDGWLLTVPECKDRESARFQLVQAFLTLKQNDRVRKLLDERKIRPFKL